MHKDNSVHFTVYYFKPRRIDRGQFSTNNDAVCVHSTVIRLRLTIISSSWLAFVDILARSVDAL